MVRREHLRKLLNSLYILSEDRYLTLDGENIVIKSEEEEDKRYPLHMIESIISFSYKGASPALIGKCVENNIGIAFFTPHGKFLTKASGKMHGNVLLRKEQYRISDDENRSCIYARNMITGKIYNGRWILERMCRDHSEIINVEKLKAVSGEMYQKLPEIREISDLGTLRGIEGELATRYFSVFDDMILNQREDFRFNGRNRRPPKDYVNALLSFAYTMLSLDCANALESVGLDSYVGFLHRDRPGRASFALDLMEELRPLMGDKFVLSLINLKKIKKEHFVVQGDEAILLNDEGRKVFFTAWQNKKIEEIKHPFLGEKVQWGLVPYVQALLLARTIRGDLDEYPPFLWK